MDHFISLLKSRGVNTPPKNTIRCIGIDLGTTNSTVSAIVWEKGQPAPNPVRTLAIDQETPNGRHTSQMIPSIVCAQNSAPLVGEGAKVERGRMANQSSGLKPEVNIFWECKNHMGLKRTYHKAPKGYQSAKEICAHILKFIRESAEQEDSLAITRTSITVPASFRSNQRNDTQEAADIAGIKTAPGYLIDEPVAAFLDYLYSHDTSKLELTGSPKNVLIFDFGGGTCDIAIFKMFVDDQSGQIKMTPLAVSRYHRLGGGDIDLAIVHEILIPQLIAQNKLLSFDLTYEDKAKCITPALLSIAESLKIKICKEIARHDKLGRYPDGEDRKTVVTRNPGETECVLKGGHKLTLSSPLLTAFDFEKILVPFLDRDLLFARDTEYRMTCSIFAPLTDAMSRAGLSAKDIAVCLMAGSSSFIPQVQKELEEFFSAGFVLNFDTPEDAKLAISRGAAYNALALQLTDMPIVPPVMADAILLQTNAGPVEMVPAGAKLPFPGKDEWGSVSDLTVPDFQSDQLRAMRLELVTPNLLPLFFRIWRVEKSVKKNTPLRFQFNVDLDQIVRLRLNIAAAPPEDFWEYTVENPLVNIMIPENKREIIENLEETVRDGRVPPAKMQQTIMQIAELTAELGHSERALDLMRKVLAAKQGRDAALLNKMGILCGDMRDYERETKFFNMSAEVSGWDTPLFNLALSQWRREMMKEAFVSINKALVRSPHRCAPSLVLRALIADALKDIATRDDSYAEAFKIFGPLATMTDWEIGWYLTALKYTGKSDQIKQAKAEQARRSTFRDEPVAEGLLPDRGQL